MRFRLGLAGLAAVVTAATLSPVAPAAGSHVFKATYTGHGNGQVAGGQASGRGSAAGSGHVIGKSTLSGSGAGTLTSASCLSFDGKAVLKGGAGSLRLVAHGAQACVSTTGADASFSGRARVTGGTAKFAGASGTLTFHGTYVEATRKLTISFKGRVSY
jgi:hypothetical protein